MTAEEALKKYYGYDTFRVGQEEIVHALLSGRDVLAVMPTGAGKSLCYQIPAMLLPGVTVVVSPLISLMQDQVKGLNDAGIRAAYINSSLTDAQIRKALDLASKGVFKIIYAAPERLETISFLRFAQSAEISLLAVDEAHCISQWGQDFRPSYLRITEFLSALPVRPVIGAFTATATDTVRQDICDSLALHAPLEKVTGFDRPNLRFDVQTPKNKNAFLLDYLTSHAGDSGIIYCATRKNVASVTELLISAGINALPYHAGLEMDERRENQAAFVYDRVPVIVATNAFGMGIDKSNVRFVIHYNMPQSMENYYQEAGRAGRDGEASDCILLFSAADIVTNRILLQKDSEAGLSGEDAEAVWQRNFQRLNSMATYCKSTRCLRGAILSYFGESYSGKCGNCGNCCGEFQETDLTVEARGILNCVAELRGHLGVSSVIAILQGRNTAKMREIHADSLRTYGLLRGTDKDRLQLAADHLIAADCLTVSADQYPVLILGPNAVDFRNPTARLIIRTRDTIPDRAGRIQTSGGQALFDELRDLRRQFAEEIHVPPYIIFSDRTLTDMVRRMPDSHDSLLMVSGVSEGKYIKYGERFLKKIAAFTAEHPGENTTLFISSDSVPPTPGRRGKTGFRLTAEEASKAELGGELSVSEICDRLNAVRSDESIKKLTTPHITAYLVEAGYIRHDEETGRKVPTEKGSAMGICLEYRVSYRGPYTIVKYPETIQQELAAWFSGAEWLRISEENRAN